MKDLRSDSKLTLLDGLICAYLVLPLLLFCTWFQWPVALAFLALIGQGFHNALRGAWRGGIGVQTKWGVSIAAIALGWTALSGVGHFVFANLDWVIRDAVLRDLTQTAWPPKYGNEGHVALILRAPVAYYLPAAALGSVLGLQAADLLLYLWTALGFGLFLCAVTTLFSTGRERLIACALMVGFGGLDLIGVHVLEGGWPRFGEHIEWWAEFAQYSSNSTLMFWVPNHALPAWLGLALVMRLWRQPELARITPLLAAAIPLWSPLSALGLAPFFIAALNWRRDVRLVFSLRYSWPLIAIGLLMARYITMDTQSLPHGWNMSIFASPSAFWVVYLAFCFFEFGLLALVLFPLRVYDFRLVMALVILLVLPFFRFGPGNDLVMRCSIPALAVLALAAVRPLAQSRQTFWRCLLVVVLGIGALGAAQEPERAFLKDRWALTGETLAEASAAGPLPDNYIGGLAHPGLAWLMREPTLVQPSPPRPRPARPRPAP